MDLSYIVEKISTSIIHQSYLFVGDQTKYLYKKHCQCMMYVYKYTLCIIVPGFLFVTWNNSKP